MGLLVLILGLILFFGVHTLTIQRKLDPIWMNGVAVLRLLSCPSGQAG
jgi:hypothetical protein